MTPKQRDEIIKLPDVEILARTIAGKARNQGLEGMVAFANVIKNRVNDFRHRYGSTMVNVCLKPAQFSCWWVKGDNFEFVMDPPDSEMTAARVAAGLSMKGLLIDNTSGSNLYHTVSIRKKPSWATALGVFRRAVIGDHVFYFEV